MEFINKFVFVGLVRVGIKDFDYKSHYFIIIDLANFFNLFLINKKIIYYQNFDFY